MGYFNQLRQQIGSNTFADLPSPKYRWAAVSMLMRESGSQAEILLIERAKNHRDAWSGHLAMPGGRMEPRDESLHDTAVRETFEETGIELDSTDFVGRLSDVNAGHFNLKIACFVYHCRSASTLKLNRVEVADAFWVPVSELESRREVEMQKKVIDEIRCFPAIEIPGRRQPLWGITLQFVRQIRDLLAPE